MEKNFTFFLSILIISITMDFAFRSRYTRNQLSSINTINTRSGRKEILSFVHFRLSILIIFNTNSKNPEQILEPFANVSFCNSSNKTFRPKFCWEIERVKRMARIKIDPIPWQQVERIGRITYYRGGRNHDR